MRKPRLMNRWYWMYFSVTSIIQPSTENTKYSTISWHSSVQFIRGTSRVSSSDIIIEILGYFVKKYKKGVAFC